MTAVRVGRHHSFEGGSWLLVGARSHIAQATVSLLQRNDAEVWQTTRDGSDGSIRLNLPDGIPDLPTAPRGGLAIVFASITGHAVCEADVEGTRQVNVTSTVGLCDRLVARGWHVVFLSSDAVLPEFRDESDSDDQPPPRSEYGLQKHLVEQHIEALGGHGSVLRLSKVINVRSDPWASWFTHLSQAQQVSAFADYYLAPLAACHAAEAVVAVARARGGGVWQASGAVSLSYFEFLTQCQARLNLPGHVTAAWRSVAEGHRRVPTQMDASRLVQAGLWTPPSVPEVCDAISRDIVMGEAD